MAENIKVAGVKVRNSLNIKIADVVNKEKQQMQTTQNKCVNNQQNNFVWIQRKKKHRI